MHLRPGVAQIAGLHCPAVQAEAAAEGEMVEYMSSEEMKRYRLQELERERQDKVGARTDVTHMQPTHCGPVPAALAYQPQTSEGEQQDKAGTATVFNDSRLHPKCMLLGHSDTALEPVAAWTRRAMVKLRNGGPHLL